MHGSCALVDATSRENGLVVIVAFRLTAGNPRTRLVRIEDVHVDGYNLEVDPRERGRIVAHLWHVPSLSVHNRAVFLNLGALCPLDVIFGAHACTIVLTIV